MKVVNNYGDLLINIDTNCNEQKDWLNLDYEQWYENKKFNNIFSINFINPYLYMVPFPLKSITFKTEKRLNNFIQII